VKAVPIPHMFNLDSLTWRRGPKHCTAVLGSGGWTTWDASRRILWGHSGDSGNAFIGFSPDGTNGNGTFGSWTSPYAKKLATRADHNVMAIDPEREIVLIAAWSANSLYALDPSAPGEKVAQIRSAGERPSVSEFAALEYAPNLDRFVYYSANDGPNIFAIAAPPGSTWGPLLSGAWIWQSLLSTDNSLNPITHSEAMSSHSVNRSHTFGRFRISTYERTDVAILIRHVDTPVYAMRLN